MRLTLGQNAKLSPLQYIAVIVWFLASWFEFKADLEKLQFAKDCKKRGTLFGGFKVVQIKNQVMCFF